MPIRDLHHLVVGQRTNGKSVYELNQLEAEIGRNRIAIYQVGRGCRDPLVVVSGDGHETLATRLEEAIRKEEMTLNDLCTPLTSYLRNHHENTQR